MEKIETSDRLLAEFIFRQPEEAARILRRHGYSPGTPVTLDSLADAMFRAAYLDSSPALLEDVDKAIASGGYSNWVAIAITAVISIASMITSSNQAKKARKLQERIAIAQLSNAKLLQEEAIRTGAETERTRILLETLKQYQSDLQNQSTQRLKNVWVFVLILGCSIGVAIGVATLISSKPKGNG